MQRFQALQSTRNDGWDHSPICCEKDSQPTGVWMGEQICYCCCWNVQTQNDCCSCPQFWTGSPSETCPFLLGSSIGKHKTNYPMYYIHLKTKSCIKHRHTNICYMHIYIHKNQFGKGKTNYRMYHEHLKIKLLYAYTYILYVHIRINLYSIIKPILLQFPSLSQLIKKTKKSKDFNTEKTKNINHPNENCELASI